MQDLEINTRNDPEDKQAIFASSLKIVSQIVRIKLLSVTFLLLFSRLLVYDCLCIADITKTRQYPRGIQILVSTYLRGAPQVKIEKS